MITQTPAEPSDLKTQSPGERRATFRHRLVVFLLLTVVGVSLVPIACRRSSPRKTVEESAEVPLPDTSQLEPRVKQRIESMRAEVVDHPTSGSAWGRYAMVCDVHGLFETAAPAYRRARLRAPNDFRWPYQLATVLGLLGAETADVVALYEEAALRRPDYAPLYVRLGDFRASRGEEDKARSDYQKAVALDPQSSQAHRGLGQQLLRHSKAAEAIEQLRRAVELDRNNGQAFTALSQAYARTGNNDRAKQAAKIAASLDGVMADEKDEVRREALDMGISSTICEMRANSASRRGDFQAAIPDLEIVAQARPDYPYVYTRLGAAYVRTGRTDEAVAAFRKAVQLKDDLVGAHQQLGMILLRRGKLDEAIRRFARVKKYTPDDFRAYLSTAMALNRRGDLDEAEAQCKRAAKLSPESAMVYGVWGTTLLLRGEVDDAILRFRQALRIDPNNALARRRLANALAQQQQKHKPSAGQPLP